jgi:anti-sigma factor RsiW
MCEYSAKLVAWIDGEVPAGDAVEIARHLAACAECRSCAAEFRRVTRTFEEYCDAVLHASERRTTSWRKIALLAAAAAIMLTALVVYPRRHAAPAPQQPGLKLAARVDSPPPVTKSAIESVPALHPREPRTARQHLGVRTVRGAACCGPAETKSEVQTNAQEQRKSVNWAANEPSVQIAIPAAAMFPPGAVPEGVNFVADLSIGADGSVQQVRLHPQFSEFERRSSQP